MPRGGSRPGAGRKRKVLDVEVKAPAKKPAAAHAPAGVKEPGTPAEWPFGAVPGGVPASTPAAGGLSPLDFLLSVVRDEEADPRVRIQAASIAAPFIHIKPGDVGKKAEKQQDAAKIAGAGKFSSATAPLKLIKR